MLDPAAYLAGKGYRGRPASGGRELMYPCFFDCEEPPQSAKRKLYINVEECVYQCFVCGAAGGSYMLQKHFGDDPKAGSTDDAFIRRRILDWAAQVGMEMLAARDDVLLHLFNERGLDAQTVLDRKLGFIGQGWSLVGSLPEEFTRDQLKQTGLVHRDGSKEGQDYFHNHLLIPVTSRGHVIQIRGRNWGQTRGPKYLSGPGEPVRAFNLDSLDGAEEVILTEGEIDCIRLHEVLQGGDDRSRRIGVVGLPGTTSMPDDLDDRLSGLKRIYIGFDADEPGRIAGEKLRDRWGTRARILLLPSPDDTKVDWTLFLHPGQGRTAGDVLRLMSAAGGRRIYSVAESGATFRADRSRNSGLQTGWAELDGSIHPGLLPGQVVFLLAKTGCVSGDTEVVLNRAGKSYRSTMKKLHERFNGFGRPSRSDPSIFTRIQRSHNETIRLATVKEVWGSGTQMTFTLTTETGRRIRATAMHPFSTQDGWRSLDELSVGDRVHVNAGRGTRGQTVPKASYAKRTVPAHPHAARRNVRMGGNSVVLHRLVVEAAMNNMTTDAFVDYLREPSADVAHLMFLDPQLVVHHVDHCHTNNSLENLKVLTRAEHHALHAAEGKADHVLEQVGLERIVSIEPFGMEETYDLEVMDAPHCYVANGFVVHNTGKTLLLCNLAYQMRRHRILFISLEMTREEVYHRLERIYWFHHPRATLPELEAGLASIWICDENRLGEKDIAALVSEYEVETGAAPELVMVDYLGYYARGAKGSSPYEKVSNAAMQLKADAKAGRFVIISPAQVNRGAKEGKPIDLDDARESGQVEETGDFVLAAFRPDAALASEGIVNAPPNFKVKVAVLKSRHGGVGKIISLQMDQLTLAIVEDGTRLARRADEHNLQARRGLTWEALRADETRPEQLRLTDRH